MAFTNWANVLSQSFANLTNGLIAFIPNIIVALIIFIIGWLVGKALGRVVAQVINSLRFDQALKAIGAERVVSRAGFELSSGKFIGFLVEWFIIIVFLLASLQILHLTEVTSFLQLILGYIPNVIAAVLILLVAAAVAEVADRLVTGSAKAASMNAAGFLGKVARYAIWVFAILAALAQLQVAVQFVQTLFTGVVIAASLGFGLAFGLGGQESAAKYLQHLGKEIKE